VETTTTPCNPFVHIGLLEAGVVMDTLQDIITDVNILHDNGDDT